MRSRAWYGLFVFVAVFAREPASARATSHPMQAAALDALPWSSRMGLERAMAARDPSMDPRVVDGAPVLDAGGVRATFDGDGAHFAGGGSMRAIAFGRGEMHPLGTSEPTIGEHQVDTDRGDGITEWWRALPSGLEHGVTIAERPHGDGELRVELAVDHLTVRAAGDDAVELVSPNGTPFASYAHLVVLDATGVSVPSRMTADGATLAIALDDAQATYPVTIDPVVAPVQEADLTMLANSLGASVALDSTATRALIGATGAGPNSTGAAVVYLRSGTTWTQEAQLTAADGVRFDEFGSAVALDSTGTRALIGAPLRLYPSTETGSAYVFVRTGTTWTQEYELTASDATPASFFGTSVALDSTGMRALVGAPGHSGNVGAAYVFVRSGTIWTQEQEVTPADAVGGAFGSSVALDSTATRALIGAPWHSANAGAAYVFVRGATWTQESAITGLRAGGYFGGAVALDSTARVALIGSYGVNTYTGAADLYARSGATWAWAGSMGPTHVGTRAYFGSSVALDSTATHALIGAPGTGIGGSGTRGEVYAYERMGVGWVLWADTAPQSSSFGCSVALDSTATRALIGERSDDSAFVFTFRPADTNGTACTSLATCRSGLCVEGVCCDTACGGGYQTTGTNCSSCLASNTGGSDGVCAALSATVASTVTCRPIATGTTCDVAEVCSPTSIACPPNGFMAATAVCHTGANCFASQTCTGTSATCPSGAAASTTICRPAMGPCDFVGACDGMSTACPAQTFGSGVVCRPSVGPCDVAESCDGTMAACPVDSFLPTATVCSSTILGPCDDVDRCTGASPACPESFLTAGTVCHISSGGVCETTTMCSGTDATCPNPYASGVVCRPAAGACDITESCSGTAANCPPDAVEGAGTVCRASTAMCDPAESCDGTSTMCAPDVTTCAPIPDAGARDAGAFDASTHDAAAPANDAANTPPPVGGSCGCRAGSRGGLLGWVVLVALGLLRRRFGRG